MDYLAQFQVQFVLLSTNKIISFRKQQLSQTREVPATYNKSLWRTESKVNYVVRFGKQK